MKVRLRHVLVADSVIMDSLTNKISAIGIFDVVQIEAEKQSRIVNFFVTAQLIFDELKEDEPLNVELQLVKPSLEVDIDKTVKLSLNPSEFPVGGRKPANIPIIVNFNGVEFSEIGTYKIKITVNGEEPTPSSAGSFEAIKLVPENK